MITVGLDIGSNSVGSAWVDTEAQTIHVGASVFPAGVDETDTKRGSPVNQKRREKRSQRRSMARRAGRKRALKALLITHGLLPSTSPELQQVFDTDPWQLRRKALASPLMPHELGRVLVHLNQRRGALGIDTDPDDLEEGKVKEAIDHTRAFLKDRTFGQMIADEMDGRRKTIHGANANFCQEQIRNRRGAFEFHADRQLIRDEFNLIWERQRSFSGPLSPILSDELKRQLDDPTQDDTWRHKGILFGQRHTYWDTGTLGRCDLEPTDQRCPVADRHAQEYRVIETVNNIRVTKRGEPERALTPQERTAVIAVLRQQKSATVTTIRSALGIRKKDVREFYTLNIERDQDREINTDRFYCEVIHGALSEECWLAMNEKQRESVNRALLHFDPANAEHVTKFREGIATWWNLPAETAEKLFLVWQKRPAIDKRVQLSRRAIANLLPYMNQYDEQRRRWPTQIEARQLFAEDGNNSATPEQRQRYAVNSRVIAKADRVYMRKHGQQQALPPAPMLSNPVVRKAIHEVRRHLNAYIRQYGRKPDRVIIEYARSTTQPEEARNQALALNRKREQIRKRIKEEFGLLSASPNQQEKAVDRVLLCRQQKKVCVYTGTPITEKQAADGVNVEIDHIVPLSRSQDNSLKNKVLCSTASNRGKGNRTPKEWLGEKSPAFAELQQRMAHLEKGQFKDDYFTDRDCGHKWENLNRDAPTLEQFVNSQLTDTAYASRQVGQWLRSVLFGEQDDSARRIFTTKGNYTAILRRDWQLFQELNGSLSEPEVADKQSVSRAAKNRGDHRHHAIDAVVIALTGPERIQDLAGHAEQVELARAENEARGSQSPERWPKREPLTPPWGDIASFRRQVLSSVFDEFDQREEPAASYTPFPAPHPLIVAHRPVKRRLIGYLHKDEAYGPVIGSDKLFTKRIAVTELTPKHLRVLEGWDERSKQLDNENLDAARRRTLKQELAVMADPPPGKSGIVRDRALRDRIRKCLWLNNFNPDDPKKLTKDAIKQLADANAIKMASGVPIKSVVLLRTNTDPVIIPGKVSVWDAASGRMRKQSNLDPRAARVYDSQNNHHIEIRENPRTGKWTGEKWMWNPELQRLTLRPGPVTAFEAANRIRPAKRPDGTRPQPQPAVDRCDHDNSRFIMSLAEGETIHMRHPETGQPGYFVVFKIDKPQTVHFIHHWDARASKATEKMEAREDIAVVASKLKNLGVEPGKPPVKVWVSPLGEIREIIGD